MPPDYVTKRVAVVKDDLGIADKRPQTIELEDEALRLFRQPNTRIRAGITGPAPKGGLSYREIGRHLGRSERWAAPAVESAQRRETAAAQGLQLDFDGSILALRKFTSSELLDAGFNISMVAQPRPRAQSARKALRQSPQDRRPQRRRTPRPRRPWRKTSGVVRATCPACRWGATPAPTY